MSSNHRESEHEHAVSHIYENRTSYSVPEILLLSLLVVMSLIALVLCMESNNWVQKILEKRKRLRKALQYKPSEDSARVSPGPLDSRDIVVTPVEDITIVVPADTNSIEDVIVTKIENLTRDATAPVIGVEQL